MSPEEHDRQLRLLGLPDGPMGERQVNGEILLAYRMPDKSIKWLMPPDRLTAQQCDEQIDELKRHLGIIAANRRPADEPGQ